MAMILVILDGVVIFAAACGSILAWTPSSGSRGGVPEAVLGQALFFTLCCLVAFYYNSLYDLGRVRRLACFVRRLPQSFGVALLLLGASSLLSPEISMGEGPFALSLLLILGILVPLRAVSYEILRSRLFAERLLIVGTGALARKIIEAVESRIDSMVEIVGLVQEPMSTVAPPRHLRLVGTLDRLDEIIREVRPQQIIVALAERRGRLPLETLLRARGRGIFVEEGGRAFERLTGKIAIESLAPADLVFAGKFRRSPLPPAFNRTFSLVVAILGLAATAPLLALIALVIRLDSRGSVLFLQKRVGAGGRHFRLIKFRTLHPAGRHASEWIRDNEDRVTRVGRWLRKFRLDELPQFVNILRGDMNLVGPRPHPVSNFKLFVENIPYYSLRSLVLPGVTGWAQIRYGYANNLDEETEKMRYDLYYIKHQSPWLDLRILFDTSKTVLLGLGAEGVKERRPSAAAGAGSRWRVAPVRGHRVLAGRSSLAGRVPALVDRRMRAGPTVPDGRILAG